MKWTFKGFCNATYALVVCSQGLCVMVARAQTRNSDSDASSVELPRSMGSLGDSMTAAALASFKRQEGNLPWEQIRFVLTILNFKLSGSSYSAVEDRHLSWAAGMDDGMRVMSHAQRLTFLGRNQGRLKVFNASISGAEVEDLLNDQWPKMNEWSLANLGQEAPDYLTVLIGANDVCSNSTAEMTPLNVYHARLYSLIDEIARRSPKTKILMSSLPNIEKLRKVAYNQRLFGWGPLEKCQDVWALSEMCPTLTLIDDAREREIVANRVIDINYAMMDVANRVNDGGRRDQVRVSRKIYEQEFSANDISMDCFHPNVDGQARLSYQTWSDTWWGRDWTLGDDMAVRRGKPNARKCFARNAKGELKESVCPSLDARDRTRNPASLAK
jgi:hypothetical protein